MKQMMIDLETLDTRASAVIVSVGAVVFDENGIHRKAYWILDTEEQLKRGRTISPSTIAWWMRQSEEARVVFHHPKPTGIAQFAKAFSEFFHDEKLSLWGNGADFDLSIMDDFWQRHSLPRINGWKYSDHMCFRTYNKLYDCKKLVSRKGTHHNALDDAIYQAECVIANIAKKGTL